MEEIKNRQEIEEMMKELEEEEMEKFEESSPQQEDNLQATLTKIIGTVDKLSQVVQEQAKKLAEQEQKVNDLVSVMTALLQTGQIPALQQQQNQGQVRQAGQGQQVQQGQVDYHTVASVLQSANELLRNINILRMGPEQLQQPQVNPFEEVKQTLAAAGQILSQFGEGLGKFFDSMDKIQDRAFKAWGERFAKRTEVNVDEIAEKVAEKLLSRVKGSSESGGE